MIWFSFSVGHSALRGKEGALVKRGRHLKEGRGIKKKEEARALGTWAGHSGLKEQSKEKRVGNNLRKRWTEK